MIYQIDLIPQQGHVTMIPLSQGDTGAREIRFQITANGENIALNGTESVVLIQANGSRHACRIEAGEAVIDATADMTEYCGQYYCKLQITEQNGGVISTAAFILEVEKRP